MFVSKNSFISFVCFLICLVGFSHQDIRRRHRVSARVVQTKSITALEGSPCNDTQPFCEEVPTYPESFITKALVKNNLSKYFPNYDGFEVFHHKTKAKHPGFGGHQTLKICESYRATFRPRSAENKEGDWMYVINQGKFVQEITMELCQNSDSTCEFVHLPFGYVSKCRQVFDYRRLYAFSSKGDILLDEFKIPSHCSCEIINIGIHSSSNSER